jgi:ubiquinone/menaquinone biosynthesis C-methylase UbiE
MSRDKAALWDERYIYEGHQPADLDRYTPVVRDLLLKSKRIVLGLGIQNGRILDVAGGTGKHMRFFDLAARGNSLSLVDFSAKAVSTARLSGIDAQIADLETQRLPFADEHFDLVLAQEIIEHLSDCHHLLREANRVLRNRGYLYLTTPNLAGLIDRVFLLRGKKPLAMTWDKTHIQLYLFGELENLLRTCGFEILQSTTQDVYLCFRSRFVRLPGLARLNRNWGQHIMILARKKSAVQEQAVTQ